MSEVTINADILHSFPPVDEDKLNRILENEIKANDSKFIVLDDDPTGVQTVHDIHVFTDWSVESMVEGLNDSAKIFYILTNSRSMTRKETTKVHKEIIRNARQAAEITRKNYQFISRSDSTLRGHYPLETELLRQGLEAAGRKIDGEILCPFFKEGGRFTINNTHYVQYDDKLVPAAQTEFAKDHTFGYSHSDLTSYIEEKTEGRYPAKNVVCISLNDLREENTNKIVSQLMSAENFNKVCINAVDYCDLKEFCIALYRAMAAGKTFLIRSAAGIVKVIGGISDKPLLTRAEMISGQQHNGGVIIVGSHTAKTTAQLNELLKMDGTVGIEFRSGKVLDGEKAFAAEIERCVREEEKVIQGGKTAVCYTERKLLSLPNDTKEEALIRSVKISDGVQRLVGELKVAPSFIISKGGITSSDIGTKALRVRKATVMGQIRPGIPVWRTGAESKFPGNPYVIFPGNVGNVSTLREAVEILMGKTDQICLND